MKGHNYGLCKKCNKIHTHPRGSLGKVYRGIKRPRVSKYSLEEIVIRRKKQMKNFRMNLRLDVFNLLGSKCSNPDCLVPGGCRDMRCLQIDHINGNGVDERRNFSEYQIFKKILKNGPTGYQLLCANCNWIKRYEHYELGILSNRKKSTSYKYT